MRWLLGKLPFDAETPVSVALKHLQETPKEPIELNKEIPLGLNAIILKAMQKEVANRYASAMDMHRDLIKLLKNPDDASLGDVQAASGDFPTQRIPVLGTNITKDENKDEDNNKRKQDVDSMSKKGITKKQAIVKLLIFLLIGVGLFLACIELGKYLLIMLTGQGSDVPVPNIVGYSYEEATKTLEDLGLEIEVQAKIVNSEYPEGYVIYQEKKEGYRLKKGATLGVKLSKGENKVLVPNVSTLTSTTAAKLKIETAGLVYKEEYEYHETISSGDIIRQEPEVNTEVDKGTEVKVFISMGMASGDSGLVKVPNVLDYTEDEARKALDTVNLIPKVTYISTKTKEDGKVISQTPEEGSYQTELSEIVLVVNKLNGDTSETGDDPTQGGSSTKVETKRKVKIDLSKVGERSTFNVKVVLEGIVVGKKVEYETMHSRADGVIEVEVTDAKGSMLKVYVDDVVVSEMTL